MKIMRMLSLGRNDGLLKDRSKQDFEFRVSGDVTDWCKEQVFGAELPAYALKESLGKALPCNDEEGSCGTPLTSSSVRFLLCIRLLVLARRTDGSLARFRLFCLVPFVAGFFDSF